MNRIIEAFDQVKESGHPALLPFLCAGSPELDSLVKLLPALQACMMRSTEESHQS